MWFESNVIEVDYSSKEPLLAINQEELDLAVEKSKDPEWLKNKVTESVAIINELSDKYLDLWFWDDWEYSAELVDATNAMQEIADMINKSYDDFATIEEMETSDLMSSLSALQGWSEITKILDLYREPTMWEWWGKIVRASSDWDLWFKRIGSKRQ